MTSSTARANAARVAAAPPPRTSLDIRLVVHSHFPLALPDPLAEDLPSGETAGLQLGRELARRGHKVTIFTNVERQARWSGCALVALRGSISLTTLSRYWRTTSGADTRRPQTMRAGRTGWPGCGWPSRWDRQATTETTAAVPAR